MLSPDASPSTWAPSTEGDQPPLIDPAFSNNNNVDYWNGKESTRPAVYDTWTVSMQRELRSVDAALCRAARMQALHHRAFLRGHETAALGADDAERVQRLMGIELQHPRRACRGGERTRRALRMEALQEQAHGRGVADARYAGGDRSAASP